VIDGPTPRSRRFGVRATDRRSSCFLTGGAHPAHPPSTRGGVAALTTGTPGQKQVLPLPGMPQFPGMLCSVRSVRRVRSSTRGGTQGRGEGFGAACRSVCWDMSTPEKGSQREACAFARRPMVNTPRCSSKDFRIRSPSVCTTVTRSCRTSTPGRRIVAAGARRRRRPAPGFSLNIRRRASLHPLRPPAGAAFVEILYPRGCIFPDKSKTG
jgi:hypothetical protein